MLWLLFSLSAVAGPKDYVDVQKYDMTLKFVDKCVLRKEVAEALSRVHTTLKLQQLFLKVKTCYVPTSQKPKRHEDRGMSVEVGLMNDVGKEIPIADKNEKLLKRAMESERFESLSKGHFDFDGWKEKPAEDFLPKVVN